MSSDELQQRRDVLLQLQESLMIPQLSNKYRHPVIQPDVLLPSMQTFVDSMSPKNVEPVIPEGYVAIAEVDRLVKESVIKITSTMEPVIPEGYVAINEVDRLVKESVIKIRAEKPVIPEGYVAINEVDSLVKEAVSTILVEKLKHLENTKLTFMEVIYLSASDSDKLWLTEKSQIEIIDEAILAFVETDAAKIMTNSFIEFFKGKELR